MLESCSSHLAGLNTVMGNTRIKVEYRGRDIIGGNKFKRIASRRKGKRKGGRTGRDEERRREEREKAAVGIIAVYFRKRVSQGKIGENCTRDGSQLLRNIVVIYIRISKWMSTLKEASYNKGSSRSMIANCCSNK